MGYDLNKYYDGVNSATYTLAFFNSSGQTTTITYTNDTETANISLSYGAPLQNFTLIFDIDYTEAGIPFFSNGGSASVTPSNPLYVEIQFI